MPDLENIINSVNLGHDLIGSEVKSATPGCLISRETRLGQLARMALIGSIVSESLAIVKWVKVLLTDFNDAV